MTPTTSRQQLTNERTLFNTNRSLNNTAVPSSSTLKLTPKCPWCGQKPHGQHLQPTSEHASQDQTGYASKLPRSETRICRKPYDQSVILFRLHLFACRSFRFSGNLSSVLHFHTRLVTTLPTLSRKGRQVLTKQTSGNWDWGLRRTLHQNRCLDFRITLHKFTRFHKLILRTR